eukprot:scaffold174221_cov16-Tisochrysis_lutea.AAC.1
MSHTELLLSAVLAEAAVSQLENPFIGCACVLARKLNSLVRMAGTTQCPPELQSIQSCSVPDVQENDLKCQEMEGKERWHLSEMVMSSEYALRTEVPG